jgi:epoxyqueuosine reductase
MKEGARQKDDRLGTPAGGTGDREPSVGERVRAEARALGFDAVAIARVGAGEGIARDFERYEAFVAAGMQGDMGWLARYREVRARLDGEGILPGAKSVVCVARRYQRPSEEEGKDAATAKAIARYARGRDYHSFLRRRLRRLAAFLRGLGSEEAPVHARPLCDEEPVLERAWAAASGLGFVGKNGMLIVPGLGSMLLLGEVVTTLELEVPSEQSRLADRCGSCTRCLEACPTSAFQAPYVLDPRRCVSYLTIEHRTAIAPELREGVGTHLFGCDDCQTVCPFNAGIGPRAPLSDDDGDPFVPLERWSRVRLEDLLSIDDSRWQELAEGTPLKRAGRNGLARNAAIVLGNRRDKMALAALRRAADTHEDAMVREAASWAAGQLTATLDAKR